MLVDVGEMEIEPPKRTQTLLQCGILRGIIPPQRCLGFSKWQTLKAQLLVEYESGQIICTALDKDKTHDFKLLGRSRLPLMSSQLCLAHRGDQGFAKRHASACIPLLSLSVISK